MEKTYDYYVGSLLDDSDENMKLLTDFIRAYKIEFKMKIQELLSGNDEVKAFYMKNSYYTRAAHKHARNLVKFYGKKASDMIDDTNFVNITFYAHVEILKEGDSDYRPDCRQCCATFKIPPLKKFKSCVIAQRDRTIELILDISKVPKALNFNQQLKISYCDPEIKFYLRGLFGEKPKEKQAAQKFYPIKKSAI